MALCSDAELDADASVTGEPTEAALVAWASRIGQDKNLLKQSMPRVLEAPFDSGRKMMSTVHKRKDDYIQFTKGAPDVVLTRCGFYLEDGQLLPMTEEYRKKVLQANKSMADRALRVLACGQRVWTKKPESEDADLLEQELCFLGLCGMIDPVRPEVKAAIDECREAGIRPVMITGDHVDTAAAIAKELGILQDGSLAVTSFAKNGTILIKPVYSANAGTYTFDATYTLTSDAADFLCWALPVDGNTYRVVSYSATYNCYATGAKSDFVAITQSNFNQYTLQGVTSMAQLEQKAPIASLRGAAEDASSQNGQVWNTEIGKLTFVAQYTQGTDPTYTVTACGLEFNNGTDGKGTKTVITKSNSQTDSCQYLISYTFSNPAGQTYSARSYVVYTDGQGQRHTSYSPWTNVTLAK